MDVTEYYKDRIKVHSITRREIRGFCPFHDDQRTSFSVNRKTGLWHCFTEGRGGNIFQFHQELMGMDLESAKKEILEKYGVEMEETPSNSTPGGFIPKGEIDRAHIALLESPSTLQFLKEKKGWTLSTIKKFKLGLEGDRIWIPIKEKGEYVNVRKYDYLHKNKEKFLSYREGYGKVRIFPEANLSHKKILLLEGEIDTILANQLGYNGLTLTGGAGSFPEEYIPLFKDKEVLICYDIDPPGEKGAKKVKRLLDKVANVRIVKLDITTPKDGDFTDYFILHGKTKEDFATLSGEKLESEPLKEVSLWETGVKKFFNKRVFLKVLVSGKDLSPYFSPKRISVTCSKGRKICKDCPLGEEDQILQIEGTDPDLISMIGCSSDQQRGIIKKRLSIPLNCRGYEIKVEEVYSLEVIRVIPELEFGINREYVTRTFFVLDHLTRPNRTYGFEGLVISNPKDQYATLLVDKVHYLRDSLDQFKLTEKEIKSLTLFQPGKLSIDEKLLDIYQDFTYNLTRIYHRKEILFALDLVYHSILEFKFLDKVLTRGWVDALVIGDTRSGKTETLKAMVSHYRAGEFSTGENTSFAGLVGGLQEAQGNWAISWGKIPLNDRRLVVIDEASGLPPEAIANMSGIRSEGIAEIVKIQTERTFSRTRLLWLSNPRSGRRLNSYNYGVEAIKELFGRVEDVARLDFAITTASEEVDQKEIHSLKHPKISHKYTSDLCHKLIIWAWSRKKDQVIFEKGAEERIMTLSQEFGDFYSPTIPLVEPAEQRIKFARLGAALAARLFSTPDGERVLVKPEHIDFVASFLRAMYQKPSMGYDRLSVSLKRSTSLTPEEILELRKEFFQFPNWAEIRDILLSYSRFRKNDFVDQVGMDLETAREFFKWTGRRRLLRSTPSGYYKEPVFTSFLKSLLDEIPKGFDGPRGKF